MRVTVNKRQVVGYKAGDPDVSHSRDAILKELVPALYGNPATSPLCVEPVEGRTTTFDIAIPALKKN